MSTFILTITTGNDAMQFPADVARELRHVARGMVDDQTWDGAIIDPNGNTVGAFSHTTEEVEARRVDSVKVGEEIKTRDSNVWAAIKDVRAGRIEGQIVLDVGWGSIELRPDDVVFGKVE